MSTRSRSISRLGPRPPWNSSGRGGLGHSSSSSSSSSSAKVSKRRGLTRQQQTSRNSAEDEEKDQLKAAIREILLRLEPLVKVSGGAAPLKSMLNYLEEIDDSSFDNYTLVRLVKSHLRASLQEVVRSEVHLQCRDTVLTPEKMKMVAPAILSKLMTSEELAECMRSLDVSVSLAATEMMTNFDRELVLMSQHRDRSESHHHTRPPPFSRTDSGLSDSLSSTWNQSSFIFLQPSQFVRLAEKLNPYGAAEDRVEALNTLLVTQVCDVVSSPSWPHIKDGLQAALVDTNANVVQLSLKLHARMVANVTPFCTKEAFTSMTATLVALYKDKTRSHLLPLFTNEISFKKRSNNCLVKICKLLVTVCKDLPKFWARYPETYVDEMAKSMLNLVALRGGKRVLSPVHLISLVDPYAGWLKAWLHGNLGRSVVFKNFSEGFLKTSLHNMLVTLRKNNFPLLARSSGRRKGILTGPQVSFAYFSHNVNLVTLLLYYNKGRRFFPVQLPQRDEPISAQAVVQILVNFVTTQENPVMSAARIATKCLVQLTSRNQLVKSVFVNDKLLFALLKPIAKFLKDSQQMNNNSTLTNTCLILHQFLDSASGMEYALRNRYDDVSIAELCLKFASKLLSNSSPMTHSEELWLALLGMTKSIVANHSGVLDGAFVNLSYALAELYYDMDYISSCTPTNSMANLQSSAIQEKSGVERQLSQVLLACMSSPRGVFALTKGNVLDVMCRKMPDIGENPQFALAAFTANGRLALQEVNYVSNQTENVMATLMDIQQWQPSLNQKEETVSLLITGIHSALSSFDLVKELAVKTTLKETAYLDTTSCNALMESECADVVLPLQVLACLVSNLDTMIYLENQFGFRQLLSELKMEGIIDRTSLYCDFILHYTDSIGGPSEKVLPPLDIEERPALTTAQTTNSSRTGKQANELMAFLQDTKQLDHNGVWIAKARSLFRSALVSSTLNLKGDLLEQLLGHIVSNAEEVTVGESFKVELLPEDHHAIELLKSYHSSHVQRGSVSGQDLKVIVQYSKKLLRTADEDKHNEEFCGFDWFASTCLLIFGGNVNGCQMFLSRLVVSHMRTTAVYMWPQMGMGNGPETDELLMSSIGHHVELILEQECPLVYTTLKEAHVSPGIITYHWVRQLFLNTLDWHDICHYVAIVLLYGPDYVVYFGVAILIHLRARIVSHVDIEDDRMDLMQMLKTAQISGFRAGDYLPYMEQLEAKNRSKILPDMQSFFLSSQQ